MRMCGCSRLEALANAGVPAGGTRYRFLGRQDQKISDHVIRCPFSWATLDACSEGSLSHVERIARSINQPSTASTAPTSLS
jgi:hypothetical protein